MHHPIANALRKHSLGATKLARPEGRIGLPRPEGARDSSPGQAQRSPG